MALRCPHCGGSLYFDQEDSEWHCLNCGRRPESPVSTNRNPIRNPISVPDKGVSVNKNPFSTDSNSISDVKSTAIEKIAAPSKGRRQMLYLIRNLPEIPESTAAEIEARLERCGIDGLILEAIECRGKSEQSMAKYLAIPPWSIKKRAKNALRYISGWKRKKQSYKEFTSHKRAGS